MRNAGRTVSGTMILQYIWGYHFDPQTNVVDVLVCRLRNKIDKDFEKMIHDPRWVMYLKFLNRLTKTIGFRLALWSSAIFILGFLFLFAFSYFYFPHPSKYEERRLG
jgi:hypothetical protein